jgi:CHAT domain-containing protein/tetratricopeptide (TPR) repeat protein
MPRVFYVLVVGFLIGLLVPSMCWSAEAAEPETAVDAEREQRIAERDRLWQQAQEFQAAGKLSEAIAAVQETLALEEELFGDAHAELTSTLEWLANHSALAERFDEAKGFAARNQQVCQQVFGPDAWQTVSARWTADHIERLSAAEPELRRQAIALETEYSRLHREEKYREAVDKLHKLAAVEADIYGEDHPWRANTFANTASTLITLGDAAEAEPAAGKCLEIRNAKLGENHPHTARATEDLARCLREQQKYAEAAKAYARAADIYQRLGQLDDAAWLHRFRADFHRELKQDEEAVGAYEAALAAFRPTEDAVGIAYNARELGFALHRLRRFEQALPHFRTAAEAFDRLEISPQAANMFLWIGECHRETGADDPAIAAFRESTARFEKAGQQDALAASVQSLADILLQHGDVGPAAEALAKVALSEEEKTLRLAAVHLLWEQARRSQDNAQWDEAIEGGRQMLRYQLQLFGENQDDVLSSLNWLANVYHQCEDYEFPIQLHREILRIAKTLHHEQPWKVTDARLALEYTQKLSELPDVDRKRLMDASRKEGQAIRLFEAGKGREPLAFAEESLLIRTQLLGSEHSHTAASVGFLALLYSKQGEYAKAEPLFVRMLQIREKVLGMEHPDTATTLSLLAGMYYEQREYAKAQPLLVRSLEIREKALGPQHPDTVTSLDNLALLYRSQADYAGAEPLFVRSLEIREKALGPQHPDTVTSLDNLALLYRSQADYAGAEPLFVRSLEIREKVLGPQHPDTATSLYNLAGLYYKQGDYAKAEPLLVRSLEIREKVLGPQHPYTATSLHGLAGLYLLQSEYARAEPLYVRSLEIREKVLGPQHPDTAGSLDQLAGLYSAQGDYARAEPLYIRSLEIREKVLGSQHPDTAASLNNLAGLYFVQGDYAKAEPLYVRSLEIYEKVLGSQHPDTATSLSCLAGLYSVQGDYAKGQSLYVRSQEILEKVLGSEHPTTAASVNNLAGLYREQGDYAKAEPLYVRSLEIREKALGPEHLDTAASLHDLAELYLAQGDYAKAEPLCHRALGIRLRSLELAAAIQSERQQLAMLARNRWSLDVYLALAVEDGQYTESGYKHLLAWKGSALARQQAQRAVAAQPDFQPLYEELRTVTRELARRAFSIPDPQNHQAWQAEVARLSERRERLEAELSGKSAAYRAARQPPTLDDLRAALPEDAVLVDVLEYSHGRPDPDRPGWLIVERRLLAFIVAKQYPVELVNLGAVAPVSAAIDVWRAGFGRQGESAEAGQRLRTAIWEPIERVLVERNSLRSGDANASGVNSALRLVLISPDGVLSRLPLAGLPGREPGKYLLEDWPLAVIPAAQALPWLLQAEDGKRPEGNLLVLGNVDFDRRSDAPGEKPKREFLASGNRAPRDEDGTLFDSLVGTRGELASIEKMYRDRFGEAGLKTLDGARATTDALRREAPRHAYLHLATHGFFAAPRFRSALERSIHEPGWLEATVFSPPPVASQPFAGIGAAIALEDGDIVVTRLVPGGAAAASGQLTRGDRIVAVAQAAGDDRFLETAGKPLNEVTGLIRGSAGSRVWLRVKPADGGEIKTIELVRRVMDGAAEPAREDPFQAIRQHRVSGYHPGLLSGLALAGANQPEADDDGILTADEVATMDLKGVHLAVLSACETGLGETAGGEGLLGLQRAFQTAGARTVIASLWKVDDIATRDLMERFYDNHWNKDMGKLAALREAQLWMLRQRGTRGLKRLDDDPLTPSDQHLSPYYWAAFVLSGDWR